MAAILELFDSPKQRVARDPSQQGITRRYFVTGITSEVALRAYLGSVLSLFDSGLLMSGYSADPQGADVWVVEVDYGTRFGASGGPSERGGGGGGDPNASNNPDNLPTVSVSFNFDTEGEKVKITQGWSGSQYFPANDANGNPQPVINFHDAIGLKKQPGGGYKAEGIDIAQRGFGFSVNRTFGPLGGMTAAFIQACRLATYRVNSDAVDVTFNGMTFHFDPGELYFKGATGVTKAGGVPFGDYTSWEGEVTLKFAAEDNLSDVTIAGVDHVYAAGWDHVEVVYEDFEDAASSVILQKPRQVNVNVPIRRAALMPLFQ